MPIASCPACHESVMVSADAQAGSVVRCPMCLEQFQVEDFLTQLPPSLIIVSEPERSSTQDDHPAQWVGPRASETEAPAFEFTPGSAPAGDKAETRIRAVETIERPRRKSASLEITKIVAGGLIALPLAQLILWWLPGRWQRDPLQLGPKVGHVVPWIVPPNFRAASVEQGEQADEQAAENQDSPDRDHSVPKSHRTTINAGHADGIEPTKKTTMPSESAAAERKEPPGKSTLKAGSVQPGAEAAAEKTKGSVSGQNPSAVVTKPGASAPKPTSSGPTAPVSASQPSAKSAPAPSVVLGVADAPLRKAAALTKALATAQQASDVWGRAEPSEQKPIEQQNADLYDAFARLGEIVTFVDRNETGVRKSVESVQGLLMSLSLQPQKLVALGNQTASWLDRPNRAHQGVLLFGTVKSIQLQGPYYQTELELASRQRRVVFVMSRTNPSSVYQAKAHVLILGAIVDDPATNLAGYEGQQPMVVMGGFPVPLGR